jgi:hypothetical protein
LFRLSRGGASRTARFRLIGIQVFWKKIRFPSSIFNSEANPDLEPEQIFPSEDGSDNSDDYPEFMYSPGGISKEQSIVFPPSWGVFCTSEDGSSSGSYINTDQPDSLLPTIEEGCESDQGESESLPQSEDEVESSPFRQRVELVLMADLTQVDDGAAPP